MAKLNDILKEMTPQIEGLKVAAVIGLDGVVVAQIKKAEFDIETAAAQFAMWMKLVGVSVKKVGVGELEDNLVTTKSSYLLCNPLGDGLYFLMVVTSRDAVLGNARMVVKGFVDQLSKSIPR